MSIFARLDVYRDVVPRSAATNMAIDETLLEIAIVPTIRFYCWDHAALSFGYFGKFEDLAEYSDRDCVRRWTGGGVVLHGEDLTYALVIPATDDAFSESTMSIYETTHRALQRAVGAESELSTGSALKISESCFANPVRADVMLNGSKIAGAAQRRTKRGLLQQGSIQNIEITNELAERFANELSPNCSVKELSEALLARAKMIAAEKYATEKWLRRR